MSGKRAFTSMALAAAFTAALTACASVPYEERAALFEASLNSNIGQPSDSLLLRYGAPSRTLALNNGGQILEYSRSDTRISGGGTYTAYDVVRQRRQVRDEDGVVREVNERVQVPVERQSPVSQQRFTCNIRWQIDQDNIIQAVAWDGNDCF